LKERSLADEQIADQKSRISNFVEDQRLLTEQEEDLKSMSQ
jgi:hypothetical protein